MGCAVDCTEFRSARGQVFNRGHWIPPSGHSHQTLRSDRKPSLFLRTVTRRLLTGVDRWRNVQQWLEGVRLDLRQMTIVCLFETSQNRLGRLACESCGGSTVDWSVLYYIGMMWAYCTVHGTNVTVQYSVLTLQYYTVQHQTTHTLYRRQTHPHDPALQARSNNCPICLKFSSENCEMSSDMETLPGAGWLFDNCCCVSIILLI